MDFPKPPISNPQIAEDEHHVIENGQPLEKKHTDSNPAQISIDLHLHTILPSLLARDEGFGEAYRSYCFLLKQEAAIAWLLLVSREWIEGLCVVHRVVPMPDL